MFLRAVFGVTSERQSLCLSSLGIFARSLTSPAVSQQSMKQMPTTKGMTKLLYPEGILSITSGAALTAGISKTVIISSRKL